MKSEISWGRALISRDSISVFQPPPVVREVVKVFEQAEPVLQRTEDAVSDVVLSIVRLGLEAAGFDVETGKRAHEKIKVPVLFGRNGVVEKAFEADAWNRSEGRRAVAADHPYPARFGNGRAGCATPGAMVRPLLAPPGQGGGDRVDGSKRMLVDEVLLVALVAYQDAMAVKALDPAGNGAAGR